MHEWRLSVDELVNERHRRHRPMIFTTNKSLKAWGRVLHGDDLAQASSIACSSVDVCYGWMVPPFVRSTSILTRQ